jgi:hypothetical protein
MGWAGGKSLAQVMDEHPTLNFDGYGRSRISPNFNMDSERRTLAGSIDAVEAAMDYLVALPTVKVTSRRARGSYELKHKAERTSRAMTCANGYISNGCLIAAAYMLELDVEPTGINATIGVSWGPGEK